MLHVQVVSPAEVTEELVAALTADSGAVVLIAESDTAILRAPPAEQAEASVRDWWDRCQAGTAHGRSTPGPRWCGPG